MSIWAWVKEAFGGPRTTGDVAIEGDRVVLRDLARARALPQEPAEAGRKAMGVCEKCSAKLQLVVFTTAGSGEQLRIWKAYPLAIDGWLCRAQPPRTHKNHFACEVILSFQSGPSSDPNSLPKRAELPCRHRWRLTGSLSSVH